MKFKVFGSEKQPEDVVYLKLQSTEDGNVNLMVCDKNGNYCSGGYLLCLKSDGTIFRYTCVAESFGFKLDKYGRLQEDDDMGD